MNDNTHHTPHSRRRFNIEGADLGYPTLFHDGSSSIGMYTVPTDEANALIADSGFAVAEVAPGKAILTLACIHYTDTECGIYEEIGCAFFVKHINQSNGIPYLSTCINIIRATQPSFTWFLPVTEESALQCGIQMWGYPKTIEDIKHEKNTHKTITRLLKDGEEVLRFSVGNQGSKQAKPMTAPVYSIFEGEPHVGYLSQQFSNVSYGRDAELILSSHPLVAPLRNLGLPKKPLFSGHMGRLNFSMSAPQKLSQL